MQINEAATRETSEKKRNLELSRIDTGFLLNETTSEMKQYDAMKSHKALWDSGSTVTVVRIASMLSNVKQVENEQLVFENQKGVKVQCIGKLGEIKHVRVLPTATNIIVLLSRLKLLGYEIVIINYGRPVKLTKTHLGAVIYGELAAGVYWIHLQLVYDIAFWE